MKALVPTERSTSRVRHPSSAFFSRADGPHSRRMTYATRTSPPRVREAPSSYDDDDAAPNDFPSRRIERTVDGETRVYYLVDGPDVRRLRRKARRCEAQAKLLTDRLTLLGPTLVNETLVADGLEDQLGELGDAVDALLQPEPGASSRP